METTKLGGREVRLCLPKSHAVRWDIAGAIANNPMRGTAAALGVAWQAGPSERPPRASYAACKFDPLAYGGLVLDELLERGHRLDEVMEAGRAAFVLLTADLPGAREVEAHEGNSEAAEAGSTS